MLARIAADKVERAEKVQARAKDGDGKGGKEKEGGEWVSDPVIWRLIARRESRRRCGLRKRG